MEEVKRRSSFIKMAPENQEDLEFKGKVFEDEFQDEPRETQSTLQSCSQYKVSLYPQNILKALISKVERKRNPNVEEFINSQKLKFKIKVDFDDPAQLFETFDENPVKILKQATFTRVESREHQFFHLREQLHLTHSKSSQLTLQNNQSFSNIKPVACSTDANQDRHLWKKQIDNNDKMKNNMSKYWPVKESGEGKDTVGLELEKVQQSPPKAKLKPKSLPRAAAPKYKLPEQQQPSYMDDDYFDPQTNEIMFNPNWNVRYLDNNNNTYSFLDSLAPVQPLNQTLFNQTCQMGSENPAPLFSCGYLNQYFHSNTQQQSSLLNSIYGGSMKLEYPRQSQAVGGGYGKGQEFMLKRKQFYKNQLNQRKGQSQRIQPQRVMEPDTPVEQQLSPEHLHRILKDLRLHTSSQNRGGSEIPTGQTRVHTLGGPKIGGLPAYTYLDQFFPASGNQQNLFSNKYVRYFYYSANGLLHNPGQSVQQIKSQMYSTAFKGAVSLNNNDIIKHSKQVQLAPLLGNSASKKEIKNVSSFNMNTGNNMSSAKPTNFPQLDLMSAVIGKESESAGGIGLRIGKPTPNKQGVNQNILQQSQKFPGCFPYSTNILIQTPLPFLSTPHPFPTRSSTRLPLQLPLLSPQTRPLQTLQLKQTSQ